MEMKLIRVAPVALLWALTGAFPVFAEPQKPGSDISEMHHLKMTREQVDMRYGLPGVHEMEFLNVA